MKFYSWSDSFFDSIFCKLSTLYLSMYLQAGEHMMSGLKGAVDSSGPIYVIPLQVCQEFVYT